MIIEPFMVIMSSEWRVENLIFNYQLTVVLEPLRVIDAKR